MVEKWLSFGQEITAWSSQFMKTSISNRMEFAHKYFVFQPHLIYLNGKTETIITDSIHHQNRLIKRSADRVVYIQDF